MEEDSSLEVNRLGLTRTLFEFRWARLTLLTFLIARLFTSEDFSSRSYFAFGRILSSRWGEDGRLLILWFGWLSFFEALFNCNLSFLLSTLRRADYTSCWLSLALKYAKADDGTKDDRMLCCHCMHFS